MSERKAIERVIERMYRHRLKKTGRLPDGRETREMEKKAVEAANAAERRAVDRRS